ncbi:MAG: glycosyltransferase [Chitinophagaceae bacterium]|nr:glycosyltransferase [Chitinophagaceae bacterium]
MSGYINRQEQKPVVFNGQCNMGYKISPWVKKDIRQVELIHSFNTFTYIRTPFLPFIADTVMISQRRIGQHLEFYKHIKVPEKFNNRIHYIPNAIQLPESVTTKSGDQLTVLFAGRGGEEKRLHLVTGIAREAQKQNSKIRFEIMGDVSNVVNQTDFPEICFHGNLSDAIAIQAIYEKAHVLLLTSSTEGFPLVIIEAMTYGCAIIATPVGDIPVHVKDQVNGYLFTDTLNEPKIIEEGANHLNTLQGNPVLLGQMAANNVAYSKSNFDIVRFHELYGQLLKTTPIEAA